jgi:predicted ArsR family transcriptional regulator
MALTDTQIALLRHAVADPDGELAVVLPEGAAAVQARQHLDDLLKQGYLEAADVDGAADGSQRRYRITDAGRQAMGSGPADG